MFTEPNLVETVDLPGEVNIHERDIHHEGEMDIVKASPDKNLIIMDATTNLNYPDTVSYRLSKNLVTLKNFTDPYKEVINDKVAGGGIGGVVGATVGFVGSQFFNINPEFCIKFAAVTLAFVSFALSGGIKHEIKKEFDRKNEIEALKIQGSGQGVEKYCGLKIAVEKCSFKTKDGSNIVGNKFSIEDDPQGLDLKQDLLNAAKEYPLRNENIIIQRKVKIIDDELDLLQN